MPRHPIFGDIQRGDLAAVKAHVLADPAVLEERGVLQMTPLIYAIYHQQPPVALWLIEHRGQHDLETADDNGLTAMHWASIDGPLSVVQALVAAGANPVAGDSSGWTPLMTAAFHNQPDTVAFLLRLPAAKASIDHISSTPTWNALSAASYFGRQHIVQLLLDAGADPTIPAGQDSPLNRALFRNHHTIAALLRRAIAEPERAKALHKARSLLDPAGPPACLQGRVEQGAPLPRVELNTSHEDERLRAVAAFAVGLEGGEEDEGLLPELFEELLTYMLLAWADKGR